MIKKRERYAALSTGCMLTYLCNYVVMRQVYVLTCTTHENSFSPNLHARGLLDELAPATWKRSTKCNSIPGFAAEAAAAAAAAEVEHKHLGARPISLA